MSVRKSRRLSQVKWLSWHLSRIVPLDSRRILFLKLSQFDIFGLYDCVTAGSIVLT